MNDTEIIPEWATDEPQYPAMESLVQVLARREKALYAITPAVLRGIRGRLMPAQLIKLGSAILDLPDESMRDHCCEHWQRIITRKEDCPWIARWCVRGFGSMPEGTQDTRQPLWKFCKGCQSGSLSCTDGRPYLHRVTFDTSACIAVMRVTIPREPEERYNAYQEMGGANG